MDYGKMAYLRVEELENYIHKKQKSDTLKPSVAKFEPNFPLRDANEYKLNELSGVAECCAVVKITANCESAGSVMLCLGDMELSGAEFSEGAQNQIIMCSFYSAKDTFLNLKAVDGFVGIIKSVQLMIIGGNVKIDRYYADFRVVYNDSEIVTAFCKDSDISLIAYDLEGNQMWSMDIGNGLVMDICESQGSYFLAYSDNSNNLWAVKIRNQQEANRKRLGDGVDSVAVNVNDTTFNICTVKNGIVENILSDSDIITVSSPSRVDFAPAASAVWFVKNCYPPVLVIRSNGKCYLKHVIHEVAGTSHVYVTMTTTLSAV